MKRTSNNRNSVVALLMLVALFAVVLAGAHASRTPRAIRLAKTSSVLIQKRARLRGMEALRLQLKLTVPQTLR